MQKRHFFCDQFQWNFGRFLSFTAVNWNCAETAASFIWVGKNHPPMGILKKVTKIFTWKNYILSKKMMKIQAVSKKSISTKKCLPIFIFGHDFFDFETAKWVFLQVNKSSLGTCVFFVAKSREILGAVIRFCCVVVVKLEQITAQNENCTILLWNWSSYWKI